ncbi:hypothetical protein OS493_006269 [Desmophyllum pertusum]|uniref:VWFA domain-containing protein n=1 Tax=Desmophyllum pertusum TaxID=174260 RepID=A0A9X0DAZ3_9CNID|nr:hypothetical protein OS493_006269 [Desmophyllum pertusum]
MVYYADNFYIDIARADFKFIVLKSNCLFISEPTKIAKVDLGFAIGVASRDASNTLQHMKDIIKSIVDKYGTDKVHYGLITFDNKASIKIPFSSRIDSAASLKSLIDSVPVTTGGPAVDKALEAAITLFGGEGVRYDAQKVLVLMVDKKSSGDDAAATKTAMELKDSGVNIITVAVGAEAYPNNLKNISSTPDNVVNTSTTDKPDEVGNQIIDRTGAVVDNVIERF